MTDGGSTELIDSTRRRIAAPGGFYFFSKSLCGFPDVDFRAHMAVCLVLERLVKKELIVDGQLVTSLLLEYPRKHLKTTLATIALTLYLFALRVVRGEDPVDRVGIASSIRENAKRFLRPISAIVTSNQLFQLFLPELMPDFSDELVWNSEEIIFPRQRYFPEPSVDTLGAGSKATSRHYTHLVEDDMINEENYDSPQAIRKAIDLHMLYENLMELNTDVRLVTANSWAAFDLNAHIIKNEPKTAVFSVDAEAGYNERRSRLIPPDIVEMCREWEDGEGVWRARFGRPELADIRQKVGARIYNAQYKNKPFDPDVVDFRVEWMRRYEWGRRVVQGGPDERILRVDTDGLPQRIVRLRDLSVVAAWDPALGVKSDDSSRSAFVVTGVDADSNVYVLEVLAERKDPMNFIDDIIESVDRWGVSRVGIEDVLFQRLLAPVIEARLETRRLKSILAGRPDDVASRVGVGVFEPIKPLRGKDKDGRIRYLLSVPGKEGRLHAHPSHLELLDEWEHFPMSQTKDILDALAYTALLWVPGTTTEELLYLRKVVDTDLAGRDPVTGY